MMRAKIATCALLLACSFHLNAASLPEQGMTMSKVEQDFGSPVSKSGPVGHPPITRWVYDGFVVVFERSKVVHSLSVTGKEPAARPATPAPVKTAPAPVKTPAPAPAKAPAAAPVPAPATAPAPAAPAVQKPSEPVATPKNGADQVDAAEQARRQAEREAMRKARADAAARAAAQTTSSSGEADATTPAAPAATTTAPAEAAPAPKRTAEDAVKAAPGFSFDPATGRVILK